MKEETETLINKECVLTLLDDFVLYGKIISLNDAGIFFNTKQKTSFISYQEIKRVVEK